MGYTNTKVMALSKSAVNNGTLTIDILYKKKRSCV